MSIYFIISMENSAVWKIIDKHFQDNPQSLVRHHIDSYNDFLKTGIFQIVKEKNPIALNTRFDADIDDYRSQCKLYMGGKEGNRIYFGKPVIYDDHDNIHYMYPNEARLRNMTYGMTVHYDIEVEVITILADGETPEVVGAAVDYDAEGGDANKEPTNFKTKSYYEYEKGDDKQVGGAKGDTEQPKRKAKAKKYKFATPHEVAFIREATEKSLIAPNVQSQTFVLEKIYLCKIPIMAQSHYCVLSGFPREIRHTMGECLNDVGGYFIIDGKEKTVVCQEKFADNMLYIREMDGDTYLYSADMRSVSENVSKPVRTISVKMMAPKSDYSYRNIVVNIPNVRKPVPLFIVFRALGFVSDKEIITMCLLDIEKYEDMADLFIPSVYDAGGIMCQMSALKYISTLTKGKTISHAYEILADYFFPHIGEMNFLQKAYYLGYVVFRLLSVYTGLEPPTDRDNYKYKRIELVGGLMNDLFREYYTMQLRSVHLAFEEILTYNQAQYENDLQSLIKNNFQTAFNENRIVEVGFKKAFKGNWGASAHTKRIGVIQDLNRLSFNSALSHLRKTNLPLDASVKLVGPRLLHSTQWGYFDPIDTPDGGNIGIHKHLAITTYITQGMSREPMLKWLREKIDMRLLEDCSPVLISRMTKVFVNGLFAGIVANPHTDDERVRLRTHPEVEKMRLFRRNALLPIYTSITYSVKQNTIYIYTDAGRLCRPVFYRDPDSNKMSFENPTLMEKLEVDDFTWNDLTTGMNPKRVAAFNTNDYKIYEMKELYENAPDVDVKSGAQHDKMQRFKDAKAVIDYIDPSETEDAFIAMNAEELNKDRTGKYTHMEIHESLIFGIMCNQITFPENNPATRNSFSCGQSKQACSLYHTNYQVRMDKTAVVLNSGQVPLCKSRYLEHINGEENPYGENAIVAIMSYTGYNVEDGILVNEGALMRGLFSTTYFSVYETHEEKAKVGGATVDKIFTNIENTTNVVGTKPGYDYSKLDKYGMIRENTEVNDKTVLIGLTTATSDPNAPPASSGVGMQPPASSGVGMQPPGGLRIDASKTPKKGQLGVVDKSFITEGSEGHRIAKVRVREVRVPNIGDKMASRNGQKGVVGLVIPEVNMPFTRDGVRPDIIINPHAIPTRMTIGQLVECIIGKAAIIQGGFADCTAFNNKGSKIKVFGEMLSQVGFHSSGNEILYNGMTGEQLESEIFFGPTYYMRLKHMVKDKINFRTTGPRTALTRQPVSGRANDGGLRIGEMERDSVISHGISEFLRESMMERGDKYYMAVCNTTGLIAVYNPAKNLFMSPMADGPLKFTGTADGKTIGIENVTRFGRDFSVVCVPYSLKLLMQELQTINIQMRIITEDNIDQLENMTFSKNIDKLTFTKDKTIQSVVNDIKNSLKQEENITRKNQDFLAVKASPIQYDSPAYNPYGQETKENNVESPVYASTSPYVPGSESPLEQTNTDSPPYNPFSQPEQEPVQPKPDWEKLHSTKHNRPYWFNAKTGKTTWIEPFQSKYARIPEDVKEKYKQQQAERTIVEGEVEEDVLNMQDDKRLGGSQYNVGDAVYYRGDNLAPGQWTVSNVGNHFLTIEKQNPSYGGGDKQKIVQYHDVYPATQELSQYQQYGGENEMLSSYPEEPPQYYNNQANSMQPMMMGGGGGVPAINFAPVFKMVGGSDFSTGQERQSKEQTIKEGGGEPIFSKMDFENSTPSKAEESKITGGETGEIDFKRLLIKKI